MAHDVNSLRVETAGQDDVDAILELRNQAAIWLADRGINHWKAKPLRRAVIDRRLQNRETFVIRSVNGALIATLSLDFDDEFTWGPRGADGMAGYVHTIVVAPERIGDGIGRWFVQWAEQEIVKSGRHLSRLDCAEGNPGLRAWYRRLSYREVGRRDYGDAWFSVTLFEKELVLA